MRWLGIGLVGAGLALAGCDKVPDLGLPPPAALTPHPAPAAARATPSAAPPASDTVSSIPSPRLTGFHNLSASQVEALVGEPDFRRVEPPAELWQYRTAECVVDLFLYGQGDAMHVTHEDARGRDPARGGTDCGDGSQVLQNHRRAG
jgi:hypothetical protein